MGSDIHQGLDISTYLSIGQKYSPLFAVEAGEIIGLGYQAKDYPEGRNIWELYLRPSASGRDGYTWVYMHVLSSIGDVAQRTGPVRNYVIIKENGTVNASGIDVPDLVDKNNRETLATDLANNGNISALDRAAWLSAISKDGSLGASIRQNLQNIRIKNEAGDLVRVDGVAVIDFDDLNEINDKNDNVIVFFTREGEKLVPIVGYGKVPDIPHANNNPGKWEIRQDMNNAFNDYIISGSDEDEVLKRLVKIKSTVQAGEIIAVMGDSENYSYHLHLALTEKSKFAQALRLLNYSDSQIESEWNVRAYALQGDKPTYKGETYHRGFIHPQIGFLDADDPYVRRKMGAPVYGDPDYNYQIQPRGLLAAGSRVYIEKGATVPLDLFIRSWIKHKVNNSSFSGTYYPAGLNSVEYEIKNLIFQPLRNGDNSEVRFTLFGRPGENQAGIVVTRDSDHAQYMKKHPDPLDQLVYKNDTGIYPQNSDAIDPVDDQYNPGSMGKDRFVYQWNSGHYDAGDYELRVTALDFNNNKRAESVIPLSIRQITKPPVIERIVLADINDTFLGWPKPKLTNEWVMQNGSPVLTRKGFPALPEFRKNGSGTRDIRFTVLFSGNIEGSPNLVIFGKTVNGSTAVILKKPLNPVPVAGGKYQAECPVSLDEKNWIDAGTMLEGFSIEQENAQTLAKEKIIDQNPGSVVTIDPANGDKFINHETEPYVYPLYIDNKQPQMQNLALRRLRKDKTEELKVGYNFNMATGKTEVRQAGDIGPGTYRLDMTVYDDKPLDDANINVFLIDKKTINSALQIIRDYNINLVGKENDGRRSVYETAVRDLGSLQSCRHIVKNSLYQWNSSPKLMSWKKATGSSISSGGVNVYRYNLTFQNATGFSFNIQDESGEGRYRLLVMSLDDSANKLVAMVGAGGVTRDNKGFLAIADGEGDFTETNIIDDGAFLSPEFNVDYTPPRFDLFGFLTNIANGIKLQLTENLSRDVNVKLDIIGNDGQNKFKWYFRVSGVGKLAEFFATGSNNTALLNDVTITMEDNTAPTVTLDKTTGTFGISWDGMTLQGLTAFVNGAFNGHLQATLEDNAGNQWTDGILDINLQSILDDAVSQAKSAIINALGISDKTLIIGPGFSSGGIEIDPAKYILIGMGVNGKSVCITPDEERDGGKAAVEKIRKVVDQYSRANGGGKIVVTSWGKAGIWVREAIRQNQTLNARVSKLVEIGVPTGGQNSIAMAPQSYSTYLTVAPILDLLKAFKIPGMKDPETQEDMTIAQVLKTFGLDIEGMVVKSAKNDDVINPLNFISILLGRADAALTIDANSPAMARLRNFDPQSIGVAVQSVRSSLWPDMPPLLQAGVVILAGASGYAGLYGQTTIFRMDSKVFNNLDQVLGEIAADYVEQALNQYVYNPLWLKLEGEIRTLSQNGFDLVNDSVQSVVQDSLGETRCICAGA